MAETSLVAATIGPDIPSGRFPVEIHSVFRSAINLQPCGGGTPLRQNNLDRHAQHRHKGPQHPDCMEDFGAASNLITILSRESSDYPQGVRLTTAEDFTTRCLEPKATGRFQEDGVSLDRPDGAAPLHISLLNAKRLQVQSLPFIQHLDETWKAGVEQLVAMQTQADTELHIRNLVDKNLAQGLLGKRLTQAALELGESVQTSAPDSARSAISRLVGLGSGLTPSGDDFLCGFLTAAHCRLGEHSEHHQFLRELKLTVLECLSSTNAISATFLRCAAEGRVSRALHDLAEALQRGTDFGKAMMQLCAFGHSSGMDITTGFLYGLTVWE